MDYMTLVTDEERIAALRALSGALPIGSRFSISDLPQKMDELGLRQAFSPFIAGDALDARRLGAAIRSRKELPLGNGRAFSIAGENRDHSKVWVVNAAEGGPLPSGEEGPEIHIDGWFDARVKRTEVEPDRGWPRTEYLFESYLIFAKETAPGAKVLGLKKFAAQLSGLPGVVRRKTRGGSIWPNIALNHDIYVPPTRAAVAVEVAPSVTVGPEPFVRSCANCTFYDAASSECRAMRPVAGVDGAAVWPRVAAGSYCFEGDWPAAAKDDF